MLNQAADLEGWIAERCSSGSATSTGSATSFPTPGRPSEP